MAIGDPYATVSQLEGRLGTTDDGTFADILDAASKRVNWFTGREFNQAATPSARRFRAFDHERLPVNDFHTVTGLAVSVDGTAWDLANVDPRPWDGIVNGEPGWPFFDLFAVDRYWPLWQFRRATIEVTASWGWAAVPKAIIEATLDVAEVMVLGTASSMGTGLSGTISSERMGDYAISYALPQMGSFGIEVSAELRKALPYRRKRFGVA